MIDLRAYDQVPPKPKRRWYVRAGRRLARAFWITLGTIWWIFIVVIAVSAWWELTKAS